MKYVIHGASIESLASLISTRDIKLSGLVDIPAVGKCKKYNCKRNVDAAIVKCLSPKVAIYNDDSHLELGDIVSAEDIILIINSLKAVEIAVDPKTGRHKSQSINTDCYTYAEITKQFPNLKDVKDPKQFQNPSKKTIQVR